MVARTSRGQGLRDASYVAERLGVSRQGVYDMARRGDLPGVVRIGERWRFDPEVLESWLAEQMTGAR